MTDATHGHSDADWIGFLTDQCARTPISGTVVDVAPFGAFVEVATGVHGLLHRSHYAEPPQVGSTVRVRVRVRVLALDLERRRVALTAA